MSRQRLIQIFACSLFMLMLSAAAQAQTVRGGIGILSRLGNWINSTTGEGLDSTYIAVPSQPWQVIVQGYANKSDLLMKSTYDGSKMFSLVVGDITAEPHISSGLSTTAGVWVGYRGWGLGYSADITSGNGEDWDFEFSSDAYYVKLRLHSFEGGNFKTRVSGLLADPEDATADPEPFDFMQPLYLSSPVKIKSQLAEGVYIFNSSKFSYSAAYDQALIQRRSAGSLIAGLRYFHSDYDYAHDSNADLILNMNDLGRIKTWQVSLGAGYAYNWVPVKGLLVSLMAMPMITPVNRIQTYSFDSNLRQLALDDEVHSDDELKPEDYKISPLATESNWSRVMLNINSRAAISYNWSRFYISANGNFYHSRYSYRKNSGRLNDWSANLNLGVRF